MFFPPASGCLVLALVFAQSLPPTPTPWLLPNLNYPSLIYHIAWYLKVCHLQTDKTGFEFWFHDLSGSHHVRKMGLGTSPEVWWLGLHLPRQVWLLSYIRSARTPRAWRPQKIKTENRSDILTSSITSLKMAHIKKNPLKKMESVI